MSDPASSPMTSDAFIAWTTEQPEGTRHELHAGIAVSMAPERRVHALAKFHIARRLVEAVEIDATTLYEPDALVRCGPPPSPDAMKLHDPVIVVEVLSPSTRGRDNGAKLIDYFRLPTVHHYLIIPTDDRAIIHHARNADGTILTRIVREGPLHLDPPGLTVTDIFPAMR